MLENLDNYSMLKTPNRKLPIDASKNSCDSLDPLDVYSKNTLSNS